MSASRSFRGKLGRLRSDDGDGNKNVKKAIGLITKTTILHAYHAFLPSFFAITARLRRENAYFHFLQRKYTIKRRRNFISLFELGYGSLGIQLLGRFTFDKVSDLE